MNLSVFSRQLPGVEIEGERAEANSHDGPLGEDPRRPWTMLHAVFIGFVISMVFAHAPIMFLAVLGLPLEYRPACYLHVGVLHISLILRVVGDLVDSLGRWRVWGGLLNAAALLLSWSTRAVRWL